MKAPAFEYRKPRSLNEALALLGEYGDEARLLAGGQTLLATLNMRLSEPGLLIDIGGLKELRGIGRLPSGALRIGALTTHTEIESSALVAAHAPLLALAAPHIAHRAIRNRGTWGGSLAYGDPAAEWPACAVALDADLILRGPAGERRVPAGEFFLDLYSTALQDGEILVAAEIPAAPAGRRQAFDELARRHGDYAVAGLAVVGNVRAGRIEDPRCVFLGVGVTPVRARAAEAALAADGVDAAVAALEGELQPVADLTHSAAMKRHLCGVLLRRAVKQIMGEQ